MRKGLKKKKKERVPQVIKTTYVHEVGGEMVKERIKIRMAQCVLLGYLGCHIANRERLKKTYLEIS